MWHSKSFINNDGTASLSERLINFLNEEKVADFKVILADYSVLMIVYKK